MYDDDKLINIQSPDIKTLTNKIQIHSIFIFKLTYIETINKYLTNNKVRSNELGTYYIIPTKIKFVTCQSSFSDDDNGLNCVGFLEKMFPNKIKSSHFSTASIKTPSFTIPGDRPYRSIYYFMESVINKNTNYDFIKGGKRKNKSKNRRNKSKNRRNKTNRNALKLK